MVILSPFPSSFIYLYHLYFICSISIVYLNQHLRVDSKETISFAQRNAFLWTHDIKHLESKAWNFHTFKPTDSDAISANKTEETLPWTHPGSEILKEKEHKISLTVHLHTRVPDLHPYCQTHQCSER